MPNRMPTPEVPDAVVLFDGACNLCNGAVRFIVRRDPGGRFRFASLQGEAGRALLARHFPQPGGAPDSIVLIEQGKAHVRSDAALRILRRLGPFWAAVSRAGFLVPKPLRDLVYRLIAENRRRLFGKTDRCLVPSPDLKSRFLD